MMASRYLLIPFVLQMLCMAFDEFYFHWRRSLPRWERLGHPLDTLTVLLCWVLLLFVEPSPTSISLYIGLAAFSCLFVTKDEWIHTEVCEATENWLHAMLFVLHPLMLLAGGLLWPALHSTNSRMLPIRFEGFERAFFIGNTALTLIFGMYQFIYWNWIWKPLLNHRSTTESITN
jgi:hypothetical protein